MYKFTCVCQNYHGFLCVSENDFYFTSSLFRVNLKWLNVKSVSLDMRYIKNTATSVLVIKLHQLPVFIQDNAKNEKRKSSQTYIFYGFQDLIGVEEHIKHYWRSSKGTSQKSDKNQGYLEEGKGIKEEVTSIEIGNAQLSSQAENYLNFSSPKQMRVNPVSKVPALRVYPGCDRSLFGITQKQNPPGRLIASPRDLSERVPRRQVRKFTSVLYDYGLILLSRPSLLLYMLILLLALILRICIFISTRSTAQNPFLVTKHLFEELDLSKEAYRKLNVHMPIHGHRTPRGDAHLFLKESSSLLKPLDKDVEELLRKYVELQLEMIDLRQRHMERSLSPSRDAEAKSLFLSKRFYMINPSAFIGKGADDVELVPKTKPVSNRPAQHFMFTRIIGVPKNWFSSFLRLFRFFGVISAQQEAPFEHEENLVSSKGRVRYAESFLNDYEIVQYITPEEANERRQCLQISNELLKTSNLIEELFFRVNSFLFHESYEDNPFIGGKSQLWNEDAATDSVHAAYDMKREYLNPHISTDDVLHVVFLRRYADTIRYLNPLESSEYKRREDAASAAHKVFLLKELTVKNLNGMNRTVKDALSLLSSIVLDASATSGVSNSEKVINMALGTLRNLLAELQFWDSDKDLWDLHILASLTKEQMGQFLKAFHAARLHKQRAPRYTSESASDYLNKIQASIMNLSEWRYLPIFKGQLCFSRKPNQCPTAPQKPPQCSISAMPLYAPLQNTTPLRNHTPHHFHHRDPKDLPVDEPFFKKDEFFPMAQNITFKDACHNIYDSNHVDAAVVIMKERWLHELRAFLILFKNKLVSSPLTRHFIYTDDDSYPSRELSAMAMRLFNVFDRISYWYINPLYRRESFFKWLLFPSFVIEWLFGSSFKKNAESSDSFVESSIVQITKIPWGNTTDVPFNMIRNFLLRPPDLLKAKIECERQVYIIWSGVVASVILLCTAHLFF